MTNFIYKNFNSNRKYAFRWELLGNLDIGRPNLGPLTRLENYRLMQFTFRDVLEQEFGTEKTDELFYRAGKLAGNAFYQHLISDPKDFNDLVRQLQGLMRDLSMGILRIEQAELESGIIVLTVSEDLDCSGLPETGDEICVYDEGFLCALFENFTGKPFNVKEIDCWCTGDRTCRFLAKMVSMG